jgi:outer membrane protein OmpA-like peptidoglycan-associated protein
MSGVTQRAVTLGKSLWIVGTLTAVTGCAALFRGDPVPPEPPRPALSKQLPGEQADAEQGGVVRNDAGEIIDYQPLAQARSVLEQARASAAVAEYGSEALETAESRLEAAESAWQSAGAAPSDELLRRAKHEAYLARRWAQIALAQAGRERGLGELGAAKQTLEAREAADARWLGSYLVPEAYGALDFATGTARLTPGSQQVVARLADFLQDHDRYGLRISGHTDSAPPSTRNLDAFLQENPDLSEADLSEEDAAALYNLAMSKRRAGAVKAQLVEAGIESARLVVFAFGQAQPRASNDTAAGRRKNRRVEVLVVRAEEARQQAGRETVEGLGLK